VILFCIETRSRGADLIRDARGIAMTEAVIVTPLFILIWIGLATLHAVFSGRLEAQVQAHHLAFSGAMKGECQGKKEDSKTTGSSQIKQEIDTRTSDSETGILSDQADDSIRSENNLAAAEGGNSLFDWSHYTTEARVTTRGLPPAVGGPEKTMIGKAKLICNMKPTDGLGEAFYDMVEGWFD
jgi:hypothetical protein